MKPFDPRLLRHARPARTYIAALAVLGMLTAAVVIVQAQLLADGIAGAFENHDTLTALRATVLALAAVVAGRVVLAWATEATSYRASAAVKAELRRELLTRATDLGPRWLANEGGRGGGRGSAELTTLATEGIEALDGYFAAYLPQLALAAVVPAAVLIRVGVADPIAGLTIAVTLPLVPVFGALVGKATAERARQRWRALSVLSHHYLDVVSGLCTLKVFGRARAQREVIGEVTGDYRRATMGTLRVAFLSSLVLELVAMVSVAIVAAGVGLSLVYGHLDLRTGLLALILAPEAYLPLRQAAAQFHASADGLAAADDAISVIEIPVIETPSPRPLAERQRHLAVTDPHILRLDGVSVRHRGRPRPAPERLCAVIMAGEITVLAGPSGSGKSTLIDVLLGFAQPSAGHVKVIGRAGLDLIGSDGIGSDGVDLASLNCEAWRARVAWVPQDPHLFPGTVASNIRLGLPDAPDNAVQAAAHDAALDDLPLNRQVTERGGGLSSGQRRRVALARALLPGRPVLLLDEPTAGLDAATEARALDTLRAQAARGRIVAIAAHHPRVIAAADHVIRVDEQGEGETRVLLRAEALP